MNDGPWCLKEHEGAFEPVFCLGHGVQHCQGWMVFITIVFNAIFNKTVINP